MKLLNLRRFFDYYFTEFSLLHSGLSLNKISFHAIRNLPWYPFCPSIPNLILSKNV